MTESTTISCPICKAPADAATSPFCSKRCADRDLARWFTGAYAIPVAHQDEDEDGHIVAEGSEGATSEGATGE